MYFKPEEVDIKEPPIIVNIIKNKDKSKFDEYIDMPDVEIDEAIAKKTFTILSLGIITK